MTTKFYAGSEHVFFNENGNDVFIKPLPGQTLNISGASANAAGSDTEVQFNDSGIFGADSTFKFNKTDNILIVPVKPCKAPQVHA